MCDTKVNMLKKIFLLAFLLNSLTAIAANPEPIVRSKTSSSRYQSIYVNPYSTNSRRGVGTSSVAPTTRNSNRRYSFGNGGVDSTAATTRNSNRRYSFGNGGVDSTAATTRNSNRRYSFGNGGVDSTAATTRNSNRRYSFGNGGVDSTATTTRNSDRRYSFGNGGVDSTAATTRNSDRRYSFGNGGVDSTVPTSRFRNLSSEYSRIENLKTKEVQANDIQAKDLEVGEFTMHPSTNAPTNPKAGELYYNKSGALCLYIVDEDLNEAFWQKVSGLEHAICDPS